MKVFVSLETWDIDDTLMLLFLLHYHTLGKIEVIGIEVDSGTLEQNNFINYILQKVNVKVPVFSRNLKESKRKELPEYYYELFEGLKKQEIHFTERVEAFNYLRDKNFKVIVGGGLNFVKELLERKIIPKEIVIQGGFAGKNITGKDNPKFGNRNFMRTFNFNKDLSSTLRFLQLQKDFQFPLFLVSKNVNHLITLKLDDLKEVEIKTEAQKLYLETLKKYLTNYRQEKILHDVYACLALFDKSLFVWEEVSPVFRFSENYPEWGSVKGKTKIFITVDADYEKIKKLASFTEEINFPFQFQ